MKTIFTILFFYVALIQAFSQQDLRKIYGSFIADEKAFNYEFTENPGVGYSFELLPISPISVINELSKSLEALKKLDEKTRFKNILDQSKKLLDKMDATSKGIDSTEALIVSKDKNAKTLGAYVDSLNVVDIHFRKASDYLKRFYDYQTGNVALKPMIDSILNNQYMQKVTKFEEFKNQMDSLRKRDSKDYHEVLKREKFKKNFDDFHTEIISRIRLVENYRNVTSDLSETLSKLKLFLKNGTITRPSSFYEFIPTVFGSVLQQQLKLHDKYLIEKLALNKSDGDINVNDLEELKARLFYTLKTKLEFQETQPTAGIIMLKTSQIVVSKYFKKDSKYKLYGILKVKSVSLEFEDGVIKNIEALLIPKDSTNGNLGSTLRFRNLRPYGISGKFHPDLLRDQTLFHHSALGLHKLALNELIAYYPKLAINTENYAPENSVITLDIASGKTFQELKKEKTSDIIDLRIFGDLAGVQLGNPQGLIQAQFSKKIDLLSNFRQFTKNGNNTNLVWLKYVKPEFVISKIDQKDGFLTYSNDTAKVKAPISTIKLKVTDLYQYQFIRFGADINIFKYNIPNAQLNIQGVFNSSWYGSNIIDSTTFAVNKNKSDVNLKGERIFSNSSRFGLIVETKPESRWGASLRWDFIGFNTILSSEFALKTNNKPFRSKNLKTFSFEGFAKTGPNNKFFFRWAYNYSGDYQYYNQIQIGIQSTLQRYLEDNKK
jgi:hypothetical protein